MACISLNPSKPKARQPARLLAAVGDEGRVSNMDDEIVTDSR